MNDEDIHALESIDKLDFYNSYIFEKILKSIFFGKFWILVVALEHLLTMLRRITIKKLLDTIQIQKLSRNLGKKY